MNINYHQFLFTKYIVTPLILVLATYNTTAIYFLNSSKTRTNREKYYFCLCNYYYSFFFLGGKNVSFNNYYRNRLHYTCIT